MVSLQERFDRQFPVTWQPLGHVQIDVAVLELPGLDVRHRFPPQIIGQRGCLWVHVDEHETAQTLDPGLRQG